MHRSHSSSKRFGSTTASTIKPRHTRCALSLLMLSIHAAYAAPLPDNGAAAAPMDLDAAAVVQVHSSTPTASSGAPSQGSLDARSAQSQVSNDFVRDYISPIADFSQVIQMTPSLFSYSPNGVGLGDTSTNFRGFSDGNYNVTFDGIPFQDTNSVSHHSWVFFPSGFLGGAVVDRSPGSAAVVGVASFNGSVNLLSRTLETQARNTVSATASTWNTQMYNYEHETGQFGENGNQNLLFNVQDMKSDGYQTFNDQKRGAASFKYQNAINSDTTLTAFGSYLNLKNNTPSIKGPTRAQVAQYGNDYLLSADPTQANYYGYNFYNITTDFEYVGLTTNLGHGWKLDDKLYTYRYWNKQNYDGTKVPASAANTTANQTGVDKLNSYRTSGNLLRLSDELALGTLRTGLWSDYARSYRYQYPSNPLNWLDNAVPNFSEHYQTTTLQPFAEFEFAVTPDLKITPGVKYAHYKQAFDHLADNGGAVGPLNGAPDLRNTVQYHDVLPSLDAHYMVAPNWSLYGQYGTGDLIPPTSIYDVKNAAVAAQPKPQFSKTYQVGTVWKSARYTLDVDVFHTKLDGAYSSSLDTFGNAIYYLNGSEVNKGIEAESNVIVGGGFSVYLNGSYGSAKYDSGKWVAGAPKDTETLGLSYKHQSWDVGLFAKRVGTTFSDNGATHEAFAIAPVTVANLFANYAFNTPFSFTKKVKLQLGANNLFNRQNITSILKAGSATSSSAAPSPLDQIQMLPERSVSATISADF
ncbi:TonB-dependent receptor [Rugamonas sp.]|uniref:TonB-dependent receptor n=1 Tax=Rugamonas sp. TaxID=1926287 RepID=UPI0025E045D4|nr:TonB-dependent receptor [Rugamonas sp.]